MNEILHRAWKSGSFPFNQDILYFPEPLSFKEFQTFLEVVVSCLSDSFEGKKLLRLEDWHNQDGYITHPTPAEWGDLKSTVSSDGALYNLRGRDFDVYLAYFPESFEFILRFRVNDIFEDPRLSGISGILDITSSEEILAKIEGCLPEEARDKFKRETSKKYFDRNYGG